MTLKNSAISKGFIAAAVINIGGVLTFSKFFTNSVIADFDPAVMSNFGLLMIVVWGFAYLAISQDYSKVKWLVGVFAVEKFIYGYVWIQWMLNNDLSAVYSQDTLAGLFYTTYGVNDWVFFIFFSYVFSRLMLKKHK